MYSRFYAGDSLHTVFEYLQNDLICFFVGSNPVIEIRQTDLYQHVVPNDPVYKNFVLYICFVFWIVLKVNLLTETFIIYGFLFF